MQPTSSNPKVVLVTGASSGFGKSISTLLGQQGFKVFGTSRDPKKVQDIPQNVEMLELDVTSDTSANNCVNEVLSKAGKIDVLVNNAGFGLVGMVEEASIEEAKSQLETNFFGAVRMIKVVLPVMRKEKRGQIINMGSIAGLVAIPLQGYYCASKFALEGLTESLRHECKDLGISVSIIEPGFFKTNIGNASKRVSVRIDDYSQLRRNMSNEFQRREARGEDPQKVAKLVYQIIENPKPKLHYTIGRDKRGLFLKGLIPQTMFENQVRRIFKMAVKQSRKVP